VDVYHGHQSPKMHSSHIRVYANQFDNYKLIIKAYNWGYNKHHPNGSKLFFEEVGIIIKQCQNKFHNF
jgi:hypothetical protein